jgi:hypothetical protein
MKTILILGLGAGLIYLLLTRDAEKRDAQTGNASTASEPAAANPPDRSSAQPPNEVIAPPIRTTRMHCLTVRGLVVNREKGALLVDCNAVPPVAPWIPMSGGANMGAGDSKRLAEVAIRAQHDAEAQAFGALSIIKGASCVRADWEPARHATGTWRLIGYPQGERMHAGAVVNIIAAHAGKGILTANIVLAADDPGDWMWLKRFNPLEKRAH